MKRLFILSILVAGGIVTSCDLTVDPKNSISSSTALIDTKSYEALLVSVYDRYQSYTWGGRDIALMGDALADNAYVETSQAGGRYTGQNINSRNSQFNIWEAYPAINECSIVITTIDNLKLTDPAQQAFAKQLKGEAYFMRALSYFQLANVYGYEPNKVPASGQGQGWDKNVILRLEPVTQGADASLKSRATTTEVYQAIESDLQNAITLLPKEAAHTGVYRANLGAAYALLGKVYLYWEKWSQADANFILALQNTTAAKIPAGAASYANSFKNVPHVESLFEIQYVQAVEVAGVTGVNGAPYTYTQPTTKNAAALATFGGMTPSVELLALFEPGDSRLATFFVSATGTSGATSYTWCNKYNSANGIYTDNIKVIRYSDIILMRAEALAEQGLYPQAQALVASLRTDRGAVNPTPADASIINFILDERRRELFFEGQRWFDLKRKGRPITKPAKTGVGTIAYEDYRLLAPIPTVEVTLNPDGLPQNPNY
ncbi:membrane protein [Cytophagales bacterium WSM2-2]|nr:membrane protein [Cytophagales bacterium WSM2-2]